MGCMSAFAIWGSWTPFRRLKRVIAGMDVACSRANVFASAVLD